MFSYAKWAINDRCNLSCPYCLASKKVNELPLKDLFRIAYKLYEIGVQHIDFFGKEPLFNENIFAITDYASKRGCDFTYSLITNGKNLNRFIPDIISRNFTQIAVSYDGGYGGRSYTFDPKQATPLTEAGIEVEYSIDVHRAVLPHIVDICGSLIDKGSSLYIKPIIPHISQQDNSFADPFYITPDEFLSCIDLVTRKFNGFPITFSIPFQFNAITSKALQYENETTTIFSDLKCCAGNSLYLSSDGKAYGCGAIHYDNNGNHCVDFLTCSTEDFIHLISDGSCRFCTK